MSRLLITWTFIVVLALVVAAILHVLWGFPPCRSLTFLPQTCSMEKK